MDYKLIDVLENRVNKWVTQAENTAINSDKDAELIGQFLKDCKETEGEILSELEPEKKAKYDEYKKVLDQLKKLTAPLDKASKLFRKKLSAWTTEQERVRREAERKAIEDARRKAEEKRLAEAIETGDESRLDEPIIPEVEVDVKEVYKPDNISYRENWKFKITDEKKIPREFLTPDLKKLGEYTRAMKGQGSIPGVAIYSEKSTIVR